MILSLSPLGAGCVAVGPDYRKPSIQLPHRWNSNASTEAPRLANWWKNFNDSTLDQLIAEGIADSPDVATAKAKVRQVRAEYLMAGGSLYPTLSGDIGFTRTYTPIPKSPKQAPAPSDQKPAPLTQVSPRTDQMSSGFGTTWEIDLFGGNRRGIEAAYYATQSAGEQLRGAFVTLIGDIVTSYAQLRGVQAQIAIAERNAALQRRTVALTRTQLQAGNISQVDLLSAETQAASTEATIPGLRISYADYLNRLSVLTGRSSLALAEKLDKARPLPAVPGRVSAGLPANLLLSRPDIRAAERDYARSTADIGQKQAALYPGLSLKGDIRTGGAHFGDLAKLSTIGWSFGPSLSIPIFQGGKLRAEVDMSRAMRDQSFLAYRKAILTGLSEVENASVALNQNRLRVAQLQKIVSNSRRINELTLDQFKAGSKSFLEVLNAQRSLLSEETNLAEARTNIILNYVALQKALGGGWNGRIDVERPEVVDGYTGPRFVRPIETTTLQDTARQQ